MVIRKRQRKHCSKIKIHIRYSSARQKEKHYLSKSGFGKTPGYRQKHQVNFFKISSLLSFVTESHSVAAVDFKFRAILLPLQYWDSKCKVMQQGKKRFLLSAEHGRLRSLRTCKVEAGDMLV